jgi:hypothetical protein
VVALFAAAFADLAPRGRAVAGVAVAGLWALSLAHHYFDPRYGKEDMRSAARLLRDRGAAGEVVVAANTLVPLAYYYADGSMKVEPLWLGWATRPGRLEGAWAPKVSGAAGAWVVLSRAEDLDPGGAFARFLDDRYPAAERFEFEGVRVWHLHGSDLAAAVSRTQ